MTLSEWCEYVVDDIDFQGGVDAVMGFGRWGYHVQGESSRHLHITVRDVLRNKEQNSNIWKPLRPIRSYELYNELLTLKDNLINTKK